MVEIHVPDSFNFFLFCIENELLAEQEMMLAESFKMDVLGQPRKQPVPLPTVIKGGRPGAIPNTKVCFNFC